MIFFGDTVDDTSYGELSSLLSGFRKLVFSTFGDTGEFTEFALRRHFC